MKNHNTKKQHLQVSHMNKHRMEKLHSRSFGGKAKLQRSKLAGCFYCLSTYRPDFIDEYVDSNVTALCPYCGIDAVIPLSYVAPRTTRMHMITLKQLNRRYFNQ